jgi:hypothetical protein
MTAYKIANTVRFPISGAVLFLPQAFPHFDFFAYKAASFEIFAHPGT